MLASKHYLFQIPNLTCRKKRFYRCPQTFDGGCMLPNYFPKNINDLNEKFTSDEKCLSMKLFILDYSPKTPGGASDV